MDKSLKNILDNYFSEEIYRAVLDNGLTIIAKSDFNAPLVSVQAWVKTGSIHEDPLLGSGISHFVEHMLFKGTKKRSYQKISEDVQSAGANINAYTTFDRTVYQVDGPVEATDTALDVLSDILFNSSFSKKEIDRERSVILREIDMGKDDPDRQLSRNTFNNAFQDHPYRYPVIGESDLFKQISHSSLKDYYKRRYVPNNITLVIVGALTIEDIITLVSAYFAKAKKTPLPNTFIPQERPQIGKRTFYKKGDYHLVRGSITFHIPTITHEDSPGLYILANALGQGASSYLWQHLREKKNIVYSISASIWNPGSSGLFFITYTCDSGKRLEAEKAIFAAIANFTKTHPSKQNVEKAITQAMVGEINARKTISGQASKLGFAEVCLGSLYFPPVYINKLSKVTPKQLTSLCKKYLTADTYTSIALEPETPTEEACAAPTTVMDLPDFKLTKLKNGAKLLLQPCSALPKVHIRVLLPGGPLNEVSDKYGITGIFATLLTKDTKKRTSAKVAEYIENLGGDFSEFVGNNSFGLAIEVMPNHLPQAADILKEALLHPVFKANHFAIEKEGQMAAIRDELDEITSLGIRTLREKFFGKYPYSIDPLGTLETVENITLSDIKKFKTQAINPKNLIVSISGDFKKEDINKHFKTWIEKIKTPRTKQSKAPTFKGPSKGNYKVPVAKEQVVVFDAFPGAGITDPNFEVSEVLDELLSGMSSRLFINVREKKGMAYFVGSNRIVGKDTGMFFLYGGTSTNNYPKVLTEFEKEIERIKKGQFTTDELNRCKKRLKAAHRAGLQTPGSRAMQAGLETLYDLPLNHWRTYEKRIDKVTKNKIQAFAKKIFKKTSQVRLSIGAIKK